MSLPSFRSFGSAILAGALTLGCAAVSRSRKAVDPVVDAAAVQATSAAGADDSDRETILRIVRQHRRQASETWRRTLADAIYEESVEAGLDPLLVASIVARESSFKSRIVSRRGAVGLMQLRPWVARDLAERYDIEWNGLDTLHSPKLNLRLGIRYYQELVERFDGDESMALTAYNAGPTRVSRQLRRGTYSGSAYADRVMTLFESFHARRDRA